MLTVMIIIDCPWNRFRALCTCSCAYLAFFFSSNTIADILYKWNSCSIKVSNIFHLCYTFNSHFTQDTFHSSQNTYQQCQTAPLDPQTTPFYETSTHSLGSVRCKLLSYFRTTPVIYILPQMLGYLQIILHLCMDSSSWVWRFHAMFSPGYIWSSRNTTCIIPIR